MNQAVSPSTCATWALAVLLSSSSAGAQARPGDDARDQDSPPAAPAGVDAPASPPDTRPTMAVLPFSVNQLAINDVGRINAIVRKAVELSGGHRVQAEQTTIELYESAQSLGLDCDAQQTQCAVELGQLSDVQYVLIGTATGELDGVGVETILVDVGAGKEVARVRVRLPAARQAQIPPLRAGVTSLLKDATSLCAVSITVEPADAAVWIDGVRDDDGRLEGLSGEQHHLRVTRAGHVPHVQELRLLQCQSQQARVVLEVDPDSEVKTGPGLVELSVPWALVGASAAVAATGVAAGALAVVPYLVYQNAVAQLAQIPEDNVDAPVDAQAAYAQATWGQTWWNNAGQYALWVSAAAVTVGLVVAGVGAGWGTYLLTIDPEARPEAE